MNESTQFKNMKKLKSKYKLKNKKSFSNQTLKNLLYIYSN